MQRKTKLTVFAIVAVLGAAAFLVTGKKSQSTDSPAAFHLAVTQTPRWPPAIGGPDLVRVSKTPESIRSKLVNAPDLFEVVNSIGVDSPIEEKMAATEILFACDLALRSKPKEATTLREAAWAELSSRCGNLANIKPKDVRKQAFILKDAINKGDDSELGKMAAYSQKALSTRVLLDPESRDRLDAALQSRDLLLVKEAVATVYGVLNDGSPDARVRTQALLYAADLFAMDHATRFDYLAACSQHGRCESNSPMVPLERSFKDARELTEAKRIADQYRLALQKGVAVQELMAIR